MNFTNILSEIEKTGPEVYERLSGRRQVLKGLGSKVAAAALPFVASSFFNKAYGKETATDPIVAALNVLLEQAYLEYTFYHQGNNTGSLIAAADVAGFLAIETHKNEHVNFLKATIAALSGTAFVPDHFGASTTSGNYVPAAYDFTASGTYPTVFSVYSDFLTLAQVITDTGVHAIQGQVSPLIANTGVLMQVIQVLGTEGRHAAYIRLVRRLSGAPEIPAPWITNNISPQPASLFQPYYVSEDNVDQKNVIITTLTDSYSTSGTVPQVSATAAFDEAYAATDIATLMAPFKVA